MKVKQSLQLNIGSIFFLVSILYYMTSRQIFSVICLFLCIGFKIYVNLKLKLSFNLTL